MKKKKNEIFAKYPLFQPHLTLHHSWMISRSFSHMPASLSPPKPLKIAQAFPAVKNTFSFLLCPSSCYALLSWTWTSSLAQLPVPWRFEAFRGGKQKGVALLSTKEWYICHLNISSYPSCKRCYPLIWWGSARLSNLVKVICYEQLVSDSSPHLGSTSCLPMGGLQLLSTDDVSKQACIYSCSLRVLPSLPNLQQLIWGH